MVVQGLPSQLCECQTKKSAVLTIWRVLPISAEMNREKCVVERLSLSLLQLETISVVPVVIDQVLVVRQLVFFDQLLSVCRLCDGGGFVSKQYCSLHFPDLLQCQRIYAL